MNLVIVHDDFTSEIAQQLNALISTIPECKSRVLDENTWNANKMQISSEEYVLFIGNVADGLALKDIMQWKFKKINMKYGWIGKKALLLVEKHSFTKDELEQLKDMFEKQELNGNVGAGASVGSVAVAGVLLGLIGVGIAAIAIKVINKKNADKIYKAEYSYMINLLCNAKRVDFNAFTGIEASSEKPKQDNA